MNAEERLAHHRAEDHDPHQGADQHRAARAANVNFDIRVGVAVPRTVRVAPLPVTIVEIEPTWRGYMYFV